MHLYIEYACIRMHTHAYACIRTHTHAYALVFPKVRRNMTCIHAFIYDHACKHAYAFIHTHAYIHACSHTYAHVCIHACIRMHAYLHMHIRMHTHACACIPTYTYIPVRHRGPGTMLSGGVVGHFSHFLVFGYSP